MEMMEAMSLLVPLTAQSQQQSNTPRRMDEPFPLKLHSLLEDVENTPQADILSWDPDGRSFTIYQPKVFAETIMGQYFRQTKYKSFQRQMNLYGFAREVRGKIRGVYSHPRFMRHDRDLCLSIKRISKATQPASSSTTRLFGGSSSAPTSLGNIQKTGVLNTPAAAHTRNSITNAATSIDVSSPLFAPMVSTNNSNILLKNTINHFGLGLATTTTAETSNALPPSRNNFIQPTTFTFPPGGITAFASASRVSLDDEESMGTIDVLPTMLDQQQQQDETSMEELGALHVAV